MAKDILAQVRHALAPMVANDGGDWLVEYHAGLDAVYVTERLARPRSFTILRYALEHPDWEQHLRRSVDELRQVMGGGEIGPDDDINDPVQCSCGWSGYGYQVTVKFDRLHCPKCDGEDVTKAPQPIASQSPTNGSGRREG